MTHQTLPTESVSPEQAARERALVDEVVASFAGAESPRLRQLMEALTRHVHAFVRETRLTEEEWAAAIEFLTAVGHITDDKRQEFILLSDVLGLSMQTITVNNEAVGEATEATVFGPFFVEGAPGSSSVVTSPSARRGSPAGSRARSRTPTGGRSPGPASRCGRPTRTASTTSSTATAARPPGRTCSRTTTARYRFWAITPTPYPIPHDGPVGRMLEAVGRSPMRASHLHFMVSAEGRRTLVTHIFVVGDELLDRRQRFRGQGLPRQGLRAPARGDADARRARPRGHRVDERLASTSSSPRRGPPPPPDEKTTPTSYAAELAAACTCPH